MGDAERRFLIVAGEPSGDLHASRLVTALGRHGPVRASGVTGPALEAAGVARVRSTDDLAVIGFSAVLSRLPRILATFRAVVAEAERTRPDACVLVDAPGFNLRLGPRLHRLGLKVFYYIAPQVWAWHPERAAAMAAWVSELAVVFPFEEELFRRAGVNATFVGHPLLDALAPEVDEPTLRRELGLAADRPILGLLPGSRAQELKHHLPTMLETARRLRRDRPALAPVVALAPGAAADTGDIPAVRGRTRAVQAFATACAVASGTATLETALFATPLVVVYRTGALNYAIARRVVTLGRIGLPNIVCGEDVAPELVQGAFTAERLEAALAPWFDDPAARARQSAGLAWVREKLGAPGASERAAARLWALVS